MKLLILFVMLVGLSFPGRAMKNSGAGDLLSAPPPVGVRVAPGLFFSPTMWMYALPLFGAMSALSVGLCALPLSAVVSTLVHVSGVRCLLPGQCLRLSLAPVHAVVYAACFGAMSAPVRVVVCAASSEARSAPIRVVVCAAFSGAMSAPVRVVVCAAFSGAMSAPVCVVVCAASYGAMSAPVRMVVCAAFSGAKSAPVRVVVCAAISMAMSTPVQVTNGASGPLAEDVSVPTKGTGGGGMENAIQTQLADLGRQVAQMFNLQDLNPSGRGAPGPAAAKLGRCRRTVIHCGESGRGAAKPLPCSTGGDRLFTVLTAPVVSVGAVTWGKRRLGPYVLNRVR
uniref:Uncharacterized protein n=1 Tax=Chromera velia CCMP2878 TaxID=1169474 RepID=A0A0G4IBW7_9ALVE|eukprot:Cvel_12923.t1-p1 / transcript=Cvel_12923.t1 / gene=Cvel_12923 / organism=Chromera_velia_CCMP2878 / gene_product=Proteoglycan 4, putative / transcript_product=Proteoglycan 4, putative / location=Cvel_scaffold864:2062-7260(-) / protein_length=338 / sequence_SO=supercontig / SO=protein_coding / is_pseudo=false